MKKFTPTFALICCMLQAAVLFSQAAMTMPGTTLVPENEGALRNGAGHTYNFTPATNGILPDAFFGGAAYHSTATAWTDPCAGITTLVDCAPTTVTLSGSGMWNNQTCGPGTPGQEMIFSFTPSTTGNYTLRVTSSSGGSIDYMYKAASGGCSSAGWTCIDDISAPANRNIGFLTAGVTYYLLLDAESTSSVTHTFKIGGESIVPLCNDIIQVALDPVTCSSTVEVDELLEGGPYFCYNDYIAEIDKTPGGPACNGAWTPNIVYASDVNMSYCYRVTSLVLGISCYGTLMVTDNYPPTISCPPDLTLSIDPGLCTHTAVGAELDPIFTSDCTGATTSYLLSGATSGTGTNTLAVTAMQPGVTLVKWKAVDGSGNSATCTFTVTVTQPTPMSLSLASTDPLCNGDSNGTIDLSVTDGTSPYTYDWSNDGPENPDDDPEDLNGLAIDLYTVTVTDAIGCTATSTAILNEPPALSPTAIQTDVSCNGAADGAIDLTVANGTPGFTYYWGPGLPTTEDLNNLPAGVYCVTVTDANACTTSTCVAVAEPPAISLTILTTTSTCGASNGSIDLTVAGGASPYTYDWLNDGPENPDDDPEDLLSLPAGVYTVTVTDANGCTATISATVGNATGPSLGTTVTNVSCFGDSNGAIDLTIISGASPYTYDWSNDGPENPDNDPQDLSGLSSGTYTVTVTDNNGCTATTSATVNQSSALSLTKTVTNVSCNGGSNGAIDLSVSGGTPGYTYDWSHLPGTSNPQDVSNLAAGTYTVTVTDNNACTATTSATVTQASALSLTKTITNVSCNGGSNGAIDLTVSGGTSPYTYDWSNDGPENPDNDPQDLSGLPAGTYTVTVTDNNGCTATTSATVSQPSTLSLTKTVTNVNCSGGISGAIDLTVSGGTSPYTYDWSNDGPENPDNDPQDLSGLPAGAYTVTVTDANGCTATTSAIVTQPPAISLTTVVTNVSCNGGSNGAIDLTVLGGTSPYTYDWDNDGLENPDNDPQDLSGLFAGTYCVIVTDANFCGAITCATVASPPALTVSCPGNQTRNTAAGLCTYTAVGTEFNATSTAGNCPGAGLSYVLSGATTGSGTTTLAGKVFQKGQTLIVWTATDGVNNTATCSFTLTVNDLEGPSISCPGTQVVNTDPTTCYHTTVGTEFDPTSFSDNCPGATIACSPGGVNGTTTLAGTPFLATFITGPKTITWTVTDANSNTASCTFEINVADVQPPTISCPGAQTRNTDAGLCSYKAVGTEFNPTNVSDNCAVLTLGWALSGATSGNGANTLAGQVFQKGQTTVVWTAADFPGNSATCSFVVTVNDNQGPSISCPGAQTRNTNSGVCTYTAVGTEFNPVSFSDNCSGTTLAYALTGATTGSGATTLAGIIFNKGQTTVAWTATDGSGNPATCTFVVTVNDGQAPTIACPGAQTRNANTGLCTYTAVGTEFNPTSVSDNCSGTSIAWALSGVTTGNGANTLAGQVFQKGQTTVVWTATDAVNLTATCSFTVTINDGQAPAIACPGAQSRNANTNVCTYTAVGSEFNPVSFSDNCGGTTLAYALSGATTGSGVNTLAGKIFNKGQTTVSWTATDGSGNPATCTFVVTVNDGQAPTITCPGAQNRNTNTGVCTYTAVGTEFNPVSFSDNCPGTTISYLLSGATSGSGSNTLAGQVFQKGQTTIVWTATDAANLTATCSFTVNVKDGQNPSITCPASQTRNTNAGLCTYATVGVEFDPLNWGDNCPGATLAYTLTGATAGSGATTLAGKILNKGTTLVNWTVTDGANLTAVCAFNVTVNDGQAPTVTCPGAQTRKTDANVCTYTTQGTEFNAVSVSGDNCGGTVTLSYTLSGATSGSGGNTLAGKVFNKGQTTVTWIATDASNNSSTCSFVVTVNDLQPPAISCPGHQTRNMTLNQCGYTAIGTEFDLLSASDNCAGVPVKNYALTGATVGNGTNTLAGVIFNKGLTTVVWTATDAANNTAQCSFSVTVNDNQSPLILCLVNQTRNTNAGVCTYTVAGAEFDPPISDNCPGVSRAYMLTGATTGNGTNTLAGKILNKGITTVKWTATDAANNTVSCTFTVDVKDAQGPTITCPLNQTRNTDLNLCSYAALGAEFNPLAVGDNCSGSVGISYTLSGVTTGTGPTTLAGKVFNKGLTTVKWTATDAASNTGTCSFTVDVKDNQPPKFTSCPPVALYNINMTPACTLTIPDLASLANAAATDNCPGLTKTQSPVAGTVMTVTHNQNISVVITAKDAAGNTATCNRIVKAKDVTPPTITTCPPNRTVTLTPDCKITVPDMRAELVATDCSLPLTVTQNPAQGTVLPSDAGDVFPVTMTVKDVAGNATSCNVAVTAEFRYFAYVPIANLNNLSVINTTSNTIVATPPVGNQPFGVAVSPDGSRVYVTNNYSNNVSVINTTTNTVVTNIGVVSYPTGVCVSPDGSKVYVASYGVGPGKVSVINTATNTVITTIGVGFSPNGIVAHPDGSKVYVVNTYSYSVSIINTATNTVIGSIGVGDQPIGIAIRPDGTRLYVTNAGGFSNSVSVINTGTNVVIANIGVGSTPFGVSVSPNGNWTYVNNYLGGTVSVISTATNSVVATIGVGGGRPYGNSVTPDGNFLYVVHEQGQPKVSVINTATNTVVATVPLAANSSPKSLGNFIGGPLCLSGNNLVASPPETSYANPDTAAYREPASSDLRVMPNPFSDALTVTFALEEPRQVRAVLLDLTGRVVFLENEDAYDAGENRFAWNTEDLPGGAYLVGLKVDGKAWVYRKVMLMR